MTPDAEPLGLYAGRTDARWERMRRAELTLYGESVEVGEVMTPDRVDAFWTDEIRGRLQRDQDAVIVVWGPPGSGKSTVTMDRARKVDPTFTPETLPQRVAFKPEDIPSLYKHTPRYGAAWIDEGASSGLLATDTHTADQADLVELINMIRARNVALFVLIPDPSELAKSWRARRADYRIETQERTADSVTPTAFMGRRVRSRKFFIDEGRWLGFRDDAAANPLTWPDYRTSSDPLLRRFWAAYWPLKDAFMTRRTDEIEAGMKARANKRRVRGMG